MRVSFPWPPAILSGHAKGGTWAKVNATKKLRADAAQLASQVQWPNYGEGKPYEDDIAIRVVFTPPTKQGDRVNFPARAKPLIDGLADAMQVNDARFLPVYEFAQPCKPGSVVVEVLALTQD